MASRSLGTLTIDLIAKTGGFESGMNAAERKTKSAMRTIETSVNRFTATFTRAMTLAGTALAGFGTLAVKRLIDTNEQLYQLSKRAEGLNVSVKFLSGIGEQADDLGIKMQQLAVVFGTLNRQIATAQNGSASSKKLFADFDIDPDKAHSTEEIFLAIADSVEKYGLNVRRAGELTQIFGASGKDIVPILKQGAAAIRANNDAMAATHQIITAKDLPAIVALYNATDSIGDSFTALRNTLIVELAPAITDWAKKIQQFVANDGPAFADSIKSVVSHLKTMAEVLAATLGVIAIGKTVSGVLAFVGAMRKLATAITVVGTAANISLGWIGVLGTVVAGVVVGIGYLVTKATEYATAQSAANKVIENTNDLLAAGKQIQDALTHATAQSIPQIEARAKAQIKANEADLVSLRAKKAIAQFELQQLVQTQAQQQARSHAPLGTPGGDLYTARIGAINSKVASLRELVAATGESIAKLEKQTKDLDVRGLFVGLGGNESNAPSPSPTPRPPAAPAAKHDIPDRGLQDIQRELQAASGFYDQYGAAIAGVTDQEYAFTQTAAEATKALHEGWIGWDAYQRIIDRAKDSLNGVGDQVKKAGDSMSQFGIQAARNMQDAFADFLFDPFKDGLKGMLGSFIDTLRRMAAQALAARIFDKLLGTNGTGTSGGSGNTGLLGSFLGAIFGGGRAFGGPVAAGGLYEVNERGAPEMLAVGGRQYLMMGPQSGTVQPAQRSRAPGGTTINVAVQPTSTRRTADQVATAVARQQRIASARNG